MALHPTGRTDWGSPERLVDDRRGISFRPLGTALQSVVSVFQLDWQGRATLVNAISETQTSGDQPIRVWTNLRFGDQAIQSSGRSGESVSFASEQEQTEFIRVMIECLLAFGWVYDGLTAPPGFYRVSYDGRVYQLSDFSESTV